MRGFRSTLILLVILGGLLGYIYFVESKKTTNPSGEEAKPKVFSVVADKISEISVKPASGETTVLKKTGNSWEITQPIQAAADQSEVSGLTTNLATAEVQRVVDESPKDLKQYGLEEPRVDIAFATDGKGGLQHLLLGDKTPTGSDTYAKLPNEKKVFLVPSFLESSFNRTAFDLRDKKVLQFDRNSADALTLSLPSTTVQLTKSGEDWSITRPLQALADYGSVESLIGRLQTAQMKSLVTTDARDLKEYGLDKPEVSASVRAGGQEATLQLGKKTAEGTVYAKDAARPMVFTVESTLADDLKKTADDFRRKDVFEFRPYNANRIEITRGSDTFVFEKAKGQGKDAAEKWREVSPAQKDVDSGKMDAFLTKVTNLRVQGWAAASAKTGTDKPQVTLTVKYDDGKKQERVVFGRSGSDVYAARGGEPGAAKVDPTEFDDAVKALDALK